MASYGKGGATRRVPTTPSTSIEQAMVGATGLEPVTSTV